MKKILLVLFYCLFFFCAYTTSAQVAPPAGLLPDTVISPASFSGYAAFDQHWKYLYPWGTDHNGSARMAGSSSDHGNISLEKGNVLKITATRISADEGRSTSDPHLKIRYHSGAVHARHQVLVSDSFPRYEISGWFQAPVVKGSWPAFWITAVKGWPPESDILEYKGDSINWQNTFLVPAKALTIKTALPDAATSWHQYSAVLQKQNATDITIGYYVDGKPTGTHPANFMNKPMWIIINLQMEGSSSAPGPEGTTTYLARDVMVIRYRRVNN
jgi:hypothetical protein